MKWTGSAPGRLDVMGGISDYSGALVLQMPLLETTTVVLQELQDPVVQITSGEGERSLGTFQIPTGDFLRCLITGESFRSEIKKRENGDWAVYPAACLAVLIKEKDLTLFTGIHLKIQSGVPLGKGVSSSAAIEVASLRALASWKNLEFSGTELAVLAQKAENQYVGAPCGLMDQLASAYGIPGGLLPILCQPDRLYKPIELPVGLRVFGIDSGVKHQVTGASYGDVRTSAAMGYALIAQSLGVSAGEMKDARISGHRAGLPFQGYLANIPVSMFLSRFLNQLPDTMTGAEFLQTCGETADPYARIVPEGRYQVRVCSRHPVEEHFRTSLFKQLLERYPETDFSSSSEILTLMGELMFQSHASYSLCGLGHPKTDKLVEEIRSNLGKGVFGAKITGGGSGGTVCVLAFGEEGKTTVKRIHQEYLQKEGKSLLLIDPNRNE